MKRRPLEQGPTWVYRLTDGEGALLYVGIAFDVEQRLAQHRATKTWWPDVVFMDCERYATRDIAANVERFYIMHEYPLHNIQHRIEEPRHPYRPIGHRSYTNRGPVSSLDGQHGDCR